jgi:hypothetical protein
MMKIFDCARRLQETRLEINQWIIPACRRNGWLHWRPCYKKKKLVECSSQSWCKKMPEGSYRYPSSWLEVRGDWLNEHGVPKRSCTDEVLAAEYAAGAAEEAFSTSEGYQYVVQSMQDTKVKLTVHHAVIECDDLADDMEFQMASLEDLMDSKVKRRLKKALLDVTAADIKKRSRRIKKQ